MNIVFILVNSADPDEMQHYAAFHLGLHCLPKYTFRGCEYTKGLSIVNGPAHEEMGESQEFSKILKFRNSNF